MSHILVVDDDPDLRALAGVYLKSAGHTVDLAEDGIAGVQAAARQRPDLIVTDFQMPRLDGFGLFNAVRSDPKAAQMPVVMLTAHNSREMMNKALGLGLDDFLGKPITREELLAVVAERLKPVAPVAARSAPAAPAAAPTQSEFPGSVLCCGLCSLERFALALKKEELDELLGKFAADVATAVQRDGGWSTHPDFHHLFAAFGDSRDPQGGPHALRALRSALCIVLAAQRLKPWIASRFPGRDLPEFVVALGVHSGKVQVTPAGARGGPALRGEAAEIAAFLAESALGLHWSVAASRAAAKSAGFAFLSGRGAQLRMPKSEGTVKVVEVKGLERPTGPAPQPSKAATMIEAAVDRNANLVTYAEAAPKPPKPPRPPAAARQPQASTAPAAKKPAVAKAPAAPPPAKAPPSDDPFAGRTVVRKLADNGVVAVYLVAPVGDGAQEVLKTVLINDDNKKRKRPTLHHFVDQYAAIAALVHPNVARTTGHGLSATHLFVVQEYCTGGDLRNLIAERMVPDDVVKVLLRVAAGLRVAHQKGFIHGDLKPSNVMIRADGSFALTDFALARVIEYAAGEGESGVIMRSPDYLSPEMINAQPPDAQSDIYTLGLLLHEMLTGKRAYESPDLSRVMMDHLNAPVPKLPAGHERFQPLLDKLMAKKREERFATVQEVIAFMAQARLQSEPPATA